MKKRWKLRNAVIAGIYGIQQFPTLTRLMMALEVHWFSQGHRPLSLDEIERLTERHIVSKSLSEEEKKYFRDFLVAKGLEAWALPLSFFRLPDRIEKKYLSTLAIRQAHLARMHLIQECLPQAESILDLGGAVDIHPEGALLASGYPFQPKSISIVDLPMDERIHEKTEAGLKDFTTAKGTQIQYHYTSMTDLSMFEDETFDFVWSGQSIEHISEHDAQIVFKEVFRVLRPDGFFCLDTPNRLIMRLMSPFYLHPEHKKEYQPDELAKKIEKTGFTILKKYAVTPLPISARLGRISKLEIFREARVSDDYRVGLSFFLHCQKNRI